MREHAWPLPESVRWPVVVTTRVAKTKEQLTGGLQATAARLQTMFGEAGFPASISANIGGWMLGHSAFVVPIGFALYRCNTNARALAAYAGTLQLTVRATRDAFEALDDAEIPANLRWLYLRMPTAFAVRYWRRGVGGVSRSVRPTAVRHAELMASDRVHRDELTGRRHCRLEFKPQTQLVHHAL
jgi:hypothetical protein